MDVVIFLFRTLRMLLWVSWRYGLKPLLVSITWVVARLLRRRSTTYGSSRWASLTDLILGSAWGRPVSRLRKWKGRRGLIVGKVWGRFLRFRGDGTLLVLAPMGAGKTSALVLPQLYDQTEAAIVANDMRGELYDITARFRARLGAVYRLDAMSPATSHRFNPLTLVRIGTIHESLDALMIADLLVVPESKDAHWETSAKLVIAMVVQHVLHTRPPVARTLASVRELLAADLVTFTALLEEMAESPVVAVAEEARVTLAAVSSGSSEISSVLKNASKAMAFWSKDAIGGVLTAASDFDLMDLHRDVCTLYLMVPEDVTGVFAPLQRLVFGCALEAMVRGKDLPRPKQLPILLIDEAANLKSLQSLRAGLGWLRTYCRTVLIYQDLGQIRRHFGDDGVESFISSAGCRVVFGTRDSRAAEEISKWLGPRTITTTNQGASQSTRDFFDRSESRGSAETGRPLLDTAEVQRLSFQKLLVFMGDQVAYPILARKSWHYRVRAWRAWIDPWRGNRAPIASAPSVEPDLAVPLSPPTARPVPLEEARP